jgi:hypothetical protein
LVVPAGRRRWLGYASLVGLLVAAIAAMSLWGSNVSAFRGMVIADNFGLFLTLVILAGAILCVLLSIDYLRAQEIEQGEFYVLMLFSVAGMIIMATATDLVIIFLGLELLSLPLYILAAFQRDKAPSLEAGLKYFLLGAFSSAFFLYGMAPVDRVWPAPRWLCLQGRTGSVPLVDAGRLRRRSDRRHRFHERGSQSGCFWCILSHFSRRAPCARRGLAVGACRRRRADNDARQRCGAGPV